MSLLASQILTQTFWTTVVASGLLAGVPLLFTALGETISERAGVINIGLEGMMLVGAYAGFLGAYYGHTVWLGYLSGMAAGIAASLCMVVFCIRLGLDQIVVGIAITLAGEGITSVLQGAQFGSSYPRLGAVPAAAVPALDQIPVLGKSVFTQPPVVYLGLALAAIVAWVFRATNMGLNLRAAGEKPEALDAAGISVLATRSYAVLCTGALAGIGGAYLAIAVSGVFTPFLTQGQGFMAIVIAILGRGKPFWVVIGAFLFGVSLSLSDSLQVAGITISPDVINMIPFIAIIVALILFARRSHLPPALAVAFVRGAR